MVTSHSNPITATATAPATSDDENPILGRQLHFIRRMDSRTKAQAAAKHTTADRKYPDPTTAAATKSTASNGNSALAVKAGTTDVKSLASDVKSVATATQSAPATTLDYKSVPPPQPMSAKELNTFILQCYKDEYKNKHGESPTNSDDGYADCYDDDGDDNDCRGSPTKRQRREGGRNGSADEWGDCGFD